MTDSTEAEVPPRTEAEPTEPVRRRRRVAAPQDSDTAAPSSKSEPKETTAQPETSGEVKRRTRRAPGSATPEAAEPPVSSQSGGPRTQETPKKRTRTAKVPEGGSAAGAAPPSAAPPARKPQIGDRRPAPAPEADSDSPAAPTGGTEGGQRKRRRRGGRGRGRSGSGDQNNKSQSNNAQNKSAQGANKRQGNNSNKGGGSNRSNQGRKVKAGEPVEALLTDEAPLELSEKALASRRGKERKGRPVGRYLMAVHVHEGVTHIAMLEGRSLIEHYVSRPSDDVSEIHGNIYLGRVQNVLPGMEAAFVDIGTPKNAVLYRGDVTYDKDDIDGDKNTPPAPKAKKSGRLRRRSNEPRIEELLKARQAIICQVTKNPISHKGARLSTEVSLPGRFVVLVPNSPTYGISKRLPERERKRLRNILDKVKPKEHGVIVRTAAEGVTAEEIGRDVGRLVDQWKQITKLAQSSKAPSLLFREPELAVRIIREEFSKDYRGVIINDPTLFQQVKSYMETITPALADRIEFHDESSESLPLFERHHVAEQLLKAVDRKVWLPSGGSLIIEHTEALTVIDVNTGKNVGKSNLEETVFRNNLEAAVEIAKHLRLRDIGGIIVIDFIDMEIRKNRAEVVRVFEEALSRDKTRTYVSEISDLGLVQMTRKRIGEGLLESVSSVCEHCEGRGVQLDTARLEV